MPQVSISKTKFYKSFIGDDISDMDEAVLQIELHKYKLKAYLDYTTKTSSVMTLEEFETQIFSNFASQDHSQILEELVSQRKNTTEEEFEKMLASMETMGFITLRYNHGEWLILFDVPSKFSRLLTTIKNLFSLKPNKTQT